MLLHWVFWLCVGLADLGVGFLLGFSLISKYALSKNEQAMAKGQQLRAKLLKIQAPLGLFAIVMGGAFENWPPEDFSDAATDDAAAEGCGA